MNMKAENDQRSKHFSVPQPLAMRQHSEHSELFTAIKAESFLHLCQNHCVIANCNGFWIKEMIVTNNGISALLHKWPWSLTLLVRISVPVSRQSLVSSTSTKGFLREVCRNNSTLIDNVIELWESHKAQCQQSVLPSISTPHSNERTGWKRKNQLKLQVYKDGSENSFHVWVLSHCKHGKGQKAMKCIKSNTSLRLWFLSWCQFGARFRLESSSTPSSYAV